MTAYPKHAYVRSKALMVAYRGIPCQACGRDDGSVCGAHSNQGRHGKGRSLKASDIYAASLCSRCHQSVDSSYTLSRAEREEIWHQAHVKTVKLLIRNGSWPSNVPIPDIREFDA